MMWTDEELNYIKENEELLDKARLPLQLDGNMTYKTYKLLHKLNISLAVLRGKKFKITIYSTRGAEFKVAYLSIEDDLYESSNISSASFRISSVETMKPEAFKEYMIYNNLVQMGFRPEEPHFKTWLKLVYENTDKVEEFK